MHRDCYCEDCNHKDKRECIDNECDCCGETQYYEHDSDYEDSDDE